jgi:predicted O-methyltransferase YrrM
MDPSLRAQLDALHRAGREHDARRPDRRERLRNLEPETAALLALLVRATAARRILEAGTSNGYSTLWLADAARAVGGGVVSVEVDRARTRAAAAELDRAGLPAWVQLRVEDVRDTLRAAPDAAWDLVFLDAERPEYPALWPDLVRTLRPGGLLAADNATSHAEEMAPFRALLEGDGAWTSTVVPCGAGLLLATSGGPRPGTARS